MICKERTLKKSIEACGGKKTFIFSKSDVTLIKKHQYQWHWPCIRLVSDQYKINTKSFSNRLWQGLTLSSHSQVIPNLITDDLDVFKPEQEAGTPWVFSLTQTCNNLLTLTPPEPAVDNLQFLKNVGSLNKGNKLHHFHSVQHFFFPRKATSPTAHFSLINTSESLPGCYATTWRVSQWHGAPWSAGYFARRSSSLEASKCGRKRTDYLEGFDETHTGGPLRRLRSSLLDEVARPVRSEVRHSCCQAPLPSAGAALSHTLILPSFWDGLHFICSITVRNNR